MAHRVKCTVCGRVFDRDKEAYINTSARRYAHYKCATGVDPPIDQEQKDKEELEEYIKKIFHIDYITPKINKQIKSYMDNYGYTYSGMHGALVYAFEIKHSDINKANGGIGLVPWVYSEAKEYFNKLSSIQEKNTEIINTKTIESKVIYIRPPKRKIKKRNLFSFLDEEVLK